MLKIPRQLIVVADDFTGATDAGVQFRKAGLEVNVIIDPHQLESAWGKSDVLVIDLESRFDELQVAYDKCFRLAKHLRSLGEIILYKKMDSTLRGNIGAEIDGLMDGLGVQVTFFAPALPVYGRTTEHGHVFVHGVHLALTEAAMDPRTPVKYSRLVDILGQQSRRRVKEIPVSFFDQSSTAIDDALKNEIEAGTEIFVFDAILETDLQQVAIAIDRLHKVPMLIAGSAGLALHLPERKFIRGERLAFVFSGSVSANSREQVKHTAATDDCALFFLEGSTMFSGNFGNDRILEQVSEKIAAGIRRFVFTTALERTDVEAVLAHAARLGFSSQHATEEIARSLGQLAAELIITFKPTGVLLTGGDTAIKTVRALGAGGIRITEEVLPGIQVGTLTGSELKTVFATKSGGFGLRDAISKTMEYFKV